MNATTTAAVPLTDVSLDESVTARRMIGVVVFMVTTTVLTVAALLTPSGSGMGTHRAMGLPPCGWVATIDTPCPTCGMTTAFAHAADGNLLQSFLTQPFGFLLAMATAMAMMVGAYTAATGSRLLNAVGGLVNRRFVWTTAALLIAAWLYKILSYRGVL